MEYIWYDVVVKAIKNVRTVGDIEEKGIEKGTLRAIENLMDTLKLIVEQAMAALKAPENERAGYAGKLNK